jgi:hypothetical protein
MAPPVDETDVEQQTLTVCGYGGQMLHLST